MRVGVTHHVLAGCGFVALLHLALLLPDAAHGMGWYRPSGVVYGISGAEESFQWSQPTGTACFYKDWGYRGERRCYAPGERVDGLPATVDKAFSSVRLSGDVAVLAYTEPRGGGRRVTLDKTGDHHYLGANGVHDAIRSLQVVRTRLGCTLDCQIPAGEAFYLEALSNVSGNARFQVLMLLPLERQPALRVRHGDTNSVEVSGRRLQVQGGTPGRQFADLTFDARTVSLALTLELNRSADDGSTLGMHVAQLDRERRVIAATPVFTTASWEANAGIVSIASLAPPGGAPLHLSSVSVWRIHARNRM